MASRSTGHPHPPAASPALPDDVWNAVTESATAGRLLLLRGMPGSGRSALLHEIATRLRGVGYSVHERRGADAGILADRDQNTISAIDDLDTDAADLRAVLDAASRAARVVATISKVTPRYESDLVAEAAATSDVTLIDLPAPPAPTTADPLRVPLLRALGPRERELLQTCALADPVISVRALVHGTGVPDLEALGFLSDATRWGLLASDRDTWHITLPWLTPLLIDARPEAENRGRHAIIAQGLLADGSSSEIICHHLLRSSDRSSAVVEWMLDDASRLIETDPRRAVAILENLLETAPARSSGPDRVRSTLARAYAVAGRAPDVERLVASSRADGARDTDTLPLLVHLGEAMLRDDKVRAAVNALADIDPSEGGTEQDARERNTLLAMRSLHRVLSGDLDTGAAEAEIARTRGLDLGDELGTSVALSALAHVAYYRGALVEAVELATSAVHHANLSDSDEVRRRTRYERGMFLLHAADTSGAREVFEEELERVGRSTDAWYQPLPHIGLGLLAFHAGEWDTAVTHLETAIRLGDAVSTHWESWAARAHLAVIVLERGDLAGTARLLDDVDDDSADSPHHCLDLVLWARGLLLESLGQHREALELIERAANLVTTYEVVSRLRWLAPDALRLARKVGRTDDFAHLVELIEEVATRARCDYVTAAALRTRALFSGDVDLAGAAVELLARSERPLERAAAEVDAARLLLENPERAEAASALYTRARETYEQVGATGRLIALRSEMRSHGIATLPRTRAPAGDKTARLTPTERRVAELVSQGLSNPQIADVLVISRRTVETHLSRVFAKLEVKSRLALALRAAEGPLD